MLKGLIQRAEKSVANLVEPVVLPYLRTHRDGCVRVEIWLADFSECIGEAWYNPVDKTMSEISGEIEEMAVSHVRIKNKNTGVFYEGSLIAWGPKMHEHMAAKATAQSQ